jgi:hypothetical protein
MNYWDTLPVDIQFYIYKISLAKLIQKNGDNTLLLLLKIKQNIC